MEDRQEQNLFRDKAITSISSPDDLASYLRVTSPGVWIILAAVIILLAGLLAWAAVGTIETTADVTAVVHDHEADIVPSEQASAALEAGMPLRIASGEYVIASVDYDEYGRATAHAEAELPDGTYEAEVIVEQIHPISFLLESR